MKTRDTRSTEVERQNEPVAPRPERENVRVRREVLAELVPIENYSQELQALVANAREAGVEATRVEGFQKQMEKLLAEAEVLIRAQEDEVRRTETFARLHEDDESLEFDRDVARVVAMDTDEALHNVRKRVETSKERRAEEERRERAIVRCYSDLHRIILAYRVAGREYDLGEHLFGLTKNIDEDGFKDFVRHEMETHRQALRAREDVGALQQRADTVLRAAEQRESIIAPEEKGRIRGALRDYQETLRADGTMEKTIAEGLQARAYEQLAQALAPLEEKMDAYDFTPERVFLSVDGYRSFSVRHTREFLTQKILAGEVSEEDFAQANVKALRDVSWVLKENWVLLPENVRRAAWKTAFAEEATDPVLRNLLKSVEGYEKGSPSLRGEVHLDNQRQDISRTLDGLTGKAWHWHEENERILDALHRTEAQDQEIAARGQGLLEELVAVVAREDAQPEELYDVASHATAIVKRLRDTTLYKEMVWFRQQNEERARYRQALANDFRYAQGGVKPESLPITELAGIPPEEQAEQERFLERAEASGALAEKLSAAARSAQERARSIEWARRQERERMEAEAEAVNKREDTEQAERLKTEIREVTNKLIDIQNKLHSVDHFLRSTLPDVPRWLEHDLRKLSKRGTWATLRDNPIDDGLRWTLTIDGEEDVLKRNAPNLKSSRGELRLADVKELKATIARYQHEVMVYLEELQKAEKELRERARELAKSKVPERAVNKHIVEDHLKSARQHGGERSRSGALLDFLRSSEITFAEIEETKQEKAP